MNCLLSLIYERFVFVVFMEHLLLLCETLVLLLFEFCVNVATWTSCCSRNIRSVAYCFRNIMIL